MKPRNLVLRHNFNGKLDSEVFTVIRPHAPDFFVPGNLLELYLREQPLGQVKVLFHRDLPEDKLGDWIAFLNHGYNGAVTRQMLRRAFPTQKAQVTYSWALLKFVHRLDATKRLLYSDEKAEKLNVQLTLGALP